jgi:hypothetical protein
MNRYFLFTAALALAASAASAQDMMRRAEMGMHQAQELDYARDNRALLDSANLPKLRTKLAEAWQGMGMSPQGAKLVADAYDPKQAARLPATSLHGKSDQEVAELMQAALKEKRYLDADQLLIDYQRERLKQGTAAAPDSSK